MADISITAANVIAGTNAKKELGTAGETVAAGKTIALAADGKLVLADTNHATAALRKVRGISLNGASNGQPLVIQRGGDLTPGATLTPGLAYYASDTAGGICPVADVGAGENVVFLGIAKSASVLSLDIQNPGVTL